ncbi:MAG: flippase [Archaeoglobus sp.]|nr:flippase [Archaeoglobus sp.]
MNQSITKGTIYLGVAQLLFLISGYAIHIGLGRLLGPELYGTYAVIVYLITIVNLILTTGVPQTVSKFVSETPEISKSILKSAGKFQFLLSLAIFVLYFISADRISLLLRDASLTPLIRVSSVMIPLYAFFTIYGGYLNGLRDYRNQSLINVLYFSAKIVLVFSFVFLGFSVFGAVLGFAISPLIGLVAALIIAPLPLRSPDYKELSRIIKFSFPVIVLSVALNFSTSIDLLALKAIIGNAKEVGYYSAASMISKVPFTLLGALNMALFPAISSVTFLNDKQKTIEFIYEPFRYVAIFLIPAAIFISLTSTEFVSFLYSSRYVAAGEPLKIIIIGILFFSIFAFLLNAVVASGKPYMAMFFSIFLLISSTTLNLTLIPIFGSVGAASAVTIATFISMLFIGIYSIRNFGPIVPWKTILKVVFATAVASLIFYFNLHGILLLTQYLISFSIYFVVLKLLGEIKERDILRIRGLFLREL